MQPHWHPAALRDGTAAARANGCGPEVRKCNQCQLVQLYGKEILAPVLLILPIVVKLVMVLMEGVCVCTVLGSVSWEGALELTQLRTDPLSSQSQYH